MADGPAHENLADVAARDGITADFEDGRIVLKNARTGQRLPRYKSRGEEGWDGERVAAEKALPWGRPVRIEIPTEFWSHEYLMGVQARIYLGDLCSHMGGADEPHTCVQPPRISQGEGMQPPCVPFDPVKVRITVLEGKLSDYT